MSREFMIRARRLRRRGRQPAEIGGRPDRADRMPLAAVDSGIEEPTRHQDGFRMESILRLVAEVALKCGLLGLGLYLLLTANEAQNLRLNGVVYVVSAIWCYYDGALARRRVAVAAIEGALWYLTAIQFCKLLIAVFGAPA